MATILNFWKAFNVLLYDFDFVLWYFVSWFMATLSEWEPPTPAWAWRAQVICPSDTAKIEQNAFLHTRAVVSSLGTWHSLVNFRRDFPRLSLYLLFICCTLTQPHKYAFCTSKFPLPQNPLKRLSLIIRYIRETFEFIAARCQSWTVWWDLKVLKYNKAHKMCLVHWCMHDGVLQSLYYLSSFLLTTFFKVDTYFFPEFLRHFRLFFCHASNLFFYK